MPRVKFLVDYTVQAAGGPTYAAGQVADLNEASAAYFVHNGEAVFAPEPSPAPLVAQAESQPAEEPGEDGAGDERKASPEPTPAPTVPPPAPPAKGAKGKPGTAA